MGKGNPIKSITKVVTKVAGNIVEAPFDVINGAAKGDTNKILNGAVKGATAGSLSYNKSGGGVMNVTDTASSILGGVTGTTALKDSIDNASASQTAQEKAAQDALAKQQEEAKAAAISRRRADAAGETKTIYTTALGDVANSASGKTKKKTVLGG